MGRVVPTLFSDSMKKSYLYVLLVGMVWSCGNSKSTITEDIEVIQVSTEFSNQVDFISDTTYIALEFCEDCIIGDISKVLKTEDGFVISDQYNTGQVFKFHDDGSFQYKIGAKGDGLGNYVLPFDISLVPGTDHLAVLDQNQTKILFYSLIDGSFVEELPINFQAKSIQFLTDYKLAIHFDGQFLGTEQDYLARILDLDQEEFTYKGVLDFSKTDQNNTAGDFYLSSDGLLFSKSLNDTIYQVSENRFVPKYLVDFGDKAVNTDIKVLPLMDMRMRMMQEMPFYHNGNFIENQDFLFFLWWGEEQFENMAVWDKNQETLSNFKGKDLIFKRPFYIDDKFMYCFLTNADYENIESNVPFLGLSENHLIIKLALK